MPTLNDYLGMGLAHLQAGRMGEAEQTFRAILGQDPMHAEAMLYLGIVVSSAGQHREAIDWITRACYLRPHPVFFLNLAQVQRNVGQTREAMAAYQRVIQLDASIPDGHEGMAAVLLKEKRFAEAVPFLHEVLRLDSGRFTAHNMLGSTFCELRKYNEGIACFQQALRLQPNFAEGHYNLGRAYNDMGRLDEAFTSLDRAMSYFPFGGHKLKAAFFLPDIMQSEASIKKTRQRLQGHLTQLLKADFVIREPEPDRTLDWLPFFLAYHGENDKDVQAQLASLFQKTILGLSFTAPHCLKPRPATGPIKVGFISRHFHNHTITRLNAGLVRHLSRPQFQVTLFRFPGFDDFLSEFLRQSADKTVILSEDLATAQRQIAEHELDILFYPDIGMFLLTYFLAFARLAPIQCVTWGHPVTTGIPTMDYFLSSQDLEPEGAEAHYTERLVKLPHLTNYYYRPKLEGPPRTRADFGLPTDRNLYLCPQTLFKLHPRFDPILAGILRADPRGLIVFLEGAEPHWQKLLMERWQRTMPELIDRIHFAPRQQNDQFLHLLATADVMLDTTQFGGGNTSYEGFAVGTPIVTLAGPFLRSRLTYAMYKAMGIDEGIAADEGDYIQRAVRLGTDAGYRQSVREKILARNGVLYENAETVRELERFWIEAVANL